MAIDHYAKATCSEGLAVFVYNHRKFGISYGEQNVNALDSINFESEKRI
jgi:hypothetical protein